MDKQKLTAFANEYHDSYPRVASVCRKLILDWTTWGVLLWHWEECERDEGKRDKDEEFIIQCVLVRCDIPLPDMTEFEPKKKGLFD